MKNWKKKLVAGAVCRRWNFPDQHPLPLFDDLSMPSEPLKTLPNTIKSCTFTCYPLSFHSFFLFVFTMVCLVGTIRGRGYCIRWRILLLSSNHCVNLIVMLIPVYASLFLFFMHFVYPFFVSFCLCFICVTLNFDYP